MKRSQLSGSAKRKLAAAKQKEMTENRPKAITTFFSCTPVQPTMSRPDASHCALRVNEEGCDSVDEMEDFNTGAVKEVKNQSTLPISPSSTETCVHIQEDYPDINTRNDEKPDIKQSTGERSVPVLSMENTDPALWPRVDESMINYWLQMGPDSCRNRDGIYKNSTRRSEVIGKKGRLVMANRKLNDSAFQSISPNGEMILRHWLLYSPSTGCVYCFVCKLFCPGSSSALAGKGFDNWASIGRLASHEISPEHRQSCATYATRVSKMNVIDKQIANHYEKQCQYWRDVLQRVVSTVKFLASRGLAFRGDNEVFGDNRNGNFLGCLELLAEYDGFIAQHIATYGNAGRGTVSYLSSTTIEEFIHLMAQCLQDKIVNDIKQSKYFSVSVDSTPDVANHDQLTFTVRYVCSDSMQPIERFLKFVNISSHTGSDLFDVMKETFANLSVDLRDCRGQSYDNAANMSGKYSGVQARILALNNKAVFVPCMGHSLNLAGVAAADSCIDAVNFFAFVQEFYSFMSSSTYRWMLVENAVKTEVDAVSSSGKKLPKKLSDTRWSARADALQSLVLQYKSYQEALQKLVDDEQQKADTRAKARGLLKTMLTLENAFLATFWNSVLSRVDKTSKLLQDPALEFGIAVEMLKSLKDFLLAQRSKFNEFLDSAKTLCGHSNWKEKRTRKRKRMADDGSDTEIIQTREKQFETMVFFVIVDTIASDLQHRINAYAEIEKRFAFLSMHHAIDSDSESVRQSLMEVVDFYVGDIDVGIIDEWLQWTAFVNGLRRQWPSPAEMLTIMTESKIQSAFPNLFILLRIYVTLPITNCIGERSFSHLKRIKNYLRSTTGQNRLSDLAMLNIEADLLRTIDFTQLINGFAAAKSRRRPL